jgi:hypothetical protein
VLLPLMLAEPGVQLPLAYSERSEHGRQEIFGNHSLLPSMLVPRSTPAFPPTFSPFPLSMSALQRAPPPLQSVKSAETPSCDLRTEKSPGQNRGAYISMVTELI